MALLAWMMLVRAAEMALAMLAAMLGMEMTGKAGSLAAAALVMVVAL